MQKKLKTDSGKMERKQSLRINKKIFLEDYKNEKEMFDLRMRS